jgi:hypothetical protein
MYVCKRSIVPHYPAISPPHSTRREANIKMDTGSTTRQPPNTASKAARPCIWYLRCAVDNLFDSALLPVVTYLAAARLISTPQYCCSSTYHGTWYGTRPSRCVSLVPTSTVRGVGIDRHLIFLLSAWGFLQGGAFLMAWGIIDGVYVSVTCVHTDLVLNGGPCDLSVQYLKSGSGI